MFLNLSALVLPLYKDNLLEKNAPCFAEQIVETLSRVLSRQRRSCHRKTTFAGLLGGGALPWRDFDCGLSFCNGCGAGGSEGRFLRVRRYGVVSGAFVSEPPDLLTC